MAELRTDKGASCVRRIDMHPDVLPLTLIHATKNSNYSPNYEDLKALTNRTQLLQVVERTSTCRTKSCTQLKTTGRDVKIKEHSKHRNKKHAMTHIKGNVAVAFIFLNR